MSDDARLIARAASGDRDAFDTLVRPRWPRMFRIALRIVGEREEAEDVAQQACFRLWETLDRFRAGEDLDGWIYRMVVNLAIDALRRRRARPEDASAEPAPLRSDPASGPEGRVLAAELEEALGLVTRDLPERQKAVFVLARVEGMAPIEIARLMELAPSTVRNHLFQARAQVARRLREQFPGLLGEREDER
jgi:RNA polymerase sigma-70 factor (ECF subfamily)